MSYATRMVRSRERTSGGTKAPLTLSPVATCQGLWGTPSFPTFKEFQDKVSKRGLGALELLAVEMKAAGSYVGRSLSWQVGDQRVRGRVLLDALPGT
jgi:hypothetical protein